MSYQVLARKYRPQSFADVIGQEHVTRTLTNAIAQQRIAHGYIFSGHRGIGKTTVARILAMALNCRAGDATRPEPCGKCDSCREIREGNAVDVIEIDAATNRGIDEIRELREAARYRPARDRYKVYILDEAHQITDAAFNALLKTLEEPPPHVVFMMATTQPEDIPQTIRSRCQHFSFHAVRFEQIVAQLRDIAQKEKISADEQALALLADAGDGSVRDALSIMDQAIACCGEKLTGAQVLELVGAVPGEVLEAVMRAVAANSSQEVLNLVDKLVTEGQSPVHFARQMVRFLRNVMVTKIAGHDSTLLQISSDDRARVAGVAELFPEEDLTRFMQIILRGYSDISYRAEQRFHLELTLLKLVHAQRLLPVEEILSGVAPGPRVAMPSASSHAKPRSEAVLPATGSSTSPGDAGRALRSPFEQDRARKSSAPEMSSRVSINASSQAATAVAEPEAEPKVEPAGSQQPQAITVSAVRERVLAALENGGHRMTASTLEQGAWELTPTELFIKVPGPASLLDMAMGPEPRRIALAAASTAAGRTLKLRLESVAASNAKNSSANGQSARSSAPTASGASGRQRAAEDPVVRRLQEKFDAEIRTVIDHRQKNR